MRGIVRRPDTCGGAYRIAGTRIPVRAIKSFHKAGYSISQIRAEYPTLTAKEIKAAVEFRSTPSRLVEDMENE